MWKDFPRVGDRDEPAFLHYWDSKSELVSNAPLCSLAEGRWNHRRVNLIKLVRQLWRSSQLEGGRGPAATFGGGGWALSLYFLFFSSSITGVSSQWERKGPLSRVSDLTPLTDPPRDLDRASRGDWPLTIDPPPTHTQRRESICDGEAETNSHEWQIGAGHLTPRRTLMMNRAPPVASIAVPASLCTFKGIHSTKLMRLSAPRVCFPSSNSVMLCCYFVLKWKLFTPIYRVHCNKSVAAS